MNAEECVLTRIIKLRPIRSLSVLPSVGTDLAGVVANERWPTLTSERDEVAQRVGCEGTRKEHNARRGKRSSDLGQDPCLQLCVRVTAWTLNGMHV